MGVTFLPPGSSSVVLHEVDNEDITLYNSSGTLVGRIAAAAWEIGDLQTPGLRASIDPQGGLRFRDLNSQLMNLVDQQGMAIRDPVTGSVISELSREKLRLTDVSGGNEIVLSTQQQQTLSTPRYTGVTEVAPSSSVVVPAAALLTSNDFELSHVAAFKRATVQVGTWTPPAGWTEVIDNDFGAASTISTSVGSRGVATGVTGTYTSSQTNWDEAAGTHVIVRGVPGGTTPTIRASSQLENTTTGTVANLAIPKPAGTVAGDVLIVFVAMGNAGGSVPVGWATPDGWVFLGAQVTLTGSGATQSTLAVGTWAKLCGSSEPANYDTTINFGVGVKTIHVSMIAVQNGAKTPAGQQFMIGGYNLAGAWTPWTPTYGAGFTPGSGVNESAYMLFGKLCYFRQRFSVAADTVFTGTPLNINLPFPAEGGGVAATHFYDASATGRYSGSMAIPMSGTGTVPTAEHGQITAITPFTWAVNDYFASSGIYEIA